jgi:hypothetical protein
MNPNRKNDAHANPALQGIIFTIRKGTTQKKEKEKNPEYKPFVCVSSETVNSKLDPPCGQSIIVAGCSTASGRWI